MFDAEQAEEIQIFRIQFIFKVRHACHKCMEKV